MPRLSPAGSATVIAGPAKAGPTIRPMPLARPRRPSDSCTVATPKLTRAFAMSLTTDGTLTEFGMLLHKPQRGGDMAAHQVGRKPRVAHPDGRGVLAMFPFALPLLTLDLDDDQAIAVGAVPQAVEDIGQRGVACGAVDR